MERLILLGGGLLALVFLMKSKAKAASPQKALPPAGPTVTPSVAQGPHIYGGNVRLSRNFKVSEFIKSPRGLRKYKLTQGEFDNLSRLVKEVLQPLRNNYGPVIVTGGIRPTGLLNKDEWYRRLKDKGFKPAKDSDHYYAAAADIKLPNKSAMVAAFKWLQRLPAVRQVGLEYKMTPQGKKISHIHVAVVTPGRPKVTGDNYAFVTTYTRKR